MAAQNGLHESSACKVCPPTLAASTKLPRAQSPLAVDDSAALRRSAWWTGASLRTLLQLACGRRA